MKAGGSLRRVDGSRCQMCAVYWRLLAKGHLRRKASTCITLDIRSCLIVMCPHRSSFQCFFVIFAPPDIALLYPSITTIFHYKDDYIIIAKREILHHLAILEIALRFNVVMWRKVLQGGQLSEYKK